MPKTRAEPGDHKSLDWCTTNGQEKKVDFRVQQLSVEQSAARSAWNSIFPFGAVVWTCFMRMPSL